MSSMRSIVLMAVPTLAALFGGLFWFTRKRHTSNQLEFPKPPDKKPSKKTEALKKTEEKPTDITAQSEAVATPVKPIEKVVEAVEPVPASVVEETVVVAKQDQCLSAAAVVPKVEEDVIDWSAGTKESSWVDDVENALTQEVITNKDVDKEKCCRGVRQDSGHMESPQSEFSNSSAHDSGSDAQSELSSDSGKASSLDGAGVTSQTESHTPTAAAMPSSQEEEEEEEEEAAVSEGPQIYEFDMPSHLCGMFIGRQGVAIKQLREKTGVEVMVRPKLMTEEHQLVVLEGSQRQITRALDIIRQKFPKNKFSELDLSPAQPEVPVLQPQLMQLNLPDGVSSDVVVSSVISPNHVFVQQPTHPSFPNLECMNQFMDACYTQDASIPPLPRPIEIGVICAAPMYNSWYRAQVVQTYPETDSVDVKYVDYGGYVHVEASLLRQIRSDFTSMPFQSTECYLANVIPPADCAEFAPESAACLEELVQGKLLQAEVVGLEEDGIPYINLYCSDDSRQSYLLNRVLVDQGIAQWYEESA